MRNRSLIAGCLAALLLTVAARHPSADIRIQMHDAGDLAPHRLKAALDLGLVSISLLITWTGKHLT